MANQDRQFNVNFNWHDHRSAEMWAQNIENMKWILGEASETSAALPTKPKEKQNKEKKSVTATRLEKLLNMQEESSAYADAGKDDEAYGLLSKQYKLGPAVSHIPVLINYYKTLLKTEREDESKRVVDQLVEIVRDKLQSSPKECEMLADKYRSDKEHFKAILFYQIGGQLLAGTTDSDMALRTYQGCVLGTKLCVMDLMEKHPSYRQLIEIYVIPSMHTMTRQVNSIRGKSKKALCVIVALCQHHIEICEGLVGDYAASEATLRSSIQLLESTLGDDAKKFHLYGTALNNLGATCLRNNQPAQALQYLTQAIEANMSAQDYDTEEERAEDVRRSERAIGQAEDAMNSN